MTGFRSDRTGSSFLKFHSKHQKMQCPPNGSHSIPHLRFEGVTQPISQMLTVKFSYISLRVLLYFIPSNPRGIRGSHTDSHHIPLPTRHRELSNYLGIGAFIVKFRINQTLQRGEDTILELVYILPTRHRELNNSGLRYRGI